MSNQSNKRQLLDELYKKYILNFSEKDYVFGDGNINATTMLIGEAPGRFEIEQGIPFVGAAGKNLFDYLSIAELKREDVFITNTMKYRLQKPSSKTGKPVNRPAVKGDIEENRHFLLEEISIIDPVYIITLGNVPLRAVCGGEACIGDIHGSVIKVNICSTEYMVIALYHPASIIYNRSLEDEYKRDCLLLRELINETKRYDNINA